MLTYAVPSSQSVYVAVDEATARVTAMWCHSLRVSASPFVYQASPTVPQLAGQPEQSPQPKPFPPQHVEVEELPDPVGMTMPKPTLKRFCEMRTC